MTESMSNQEKMDLQNTLSLAYTRVSGLRHELQAAGKTAEADRLDAQAKMIRKELNRLTKDLLQAWSADAKELTRRIIQQNHRLVETLEELRADIGNAEVFTKTLGCIDDILGLTRRLP